MNSILNRPPSIADDTLVYALYPSQAQSDSASVHALAVAIRGLLDVVLKDFIWHRDPFELKISQDPHSDGWMLGGVVRVGDSVDDEWCAVWLLREISARWDLAVSVYDTDGDFLLIEAAESLPSWVTPSNSENRVWLYRSQLHLIPLSYASPPSSRRHRRRRRILRAQDSDDEKDFANLEEDYLCLADAIRVLKDPSAETRAPTSVQNAVWNRISGYPDSLKQHIHKTKAIIPVDIAKALSSDPALVQKAAEAFYTRDPIQLRTAHKMARFPPSDSILRTVRMTRTAYAQLTGQKFYPPKIFGQWQESEGNDSRRWKDIGMKLACGFEMMYQESKGRSESSRVTFDSMRSSVQARKEALRRDADYTKYIQNLVTAGYFKSEVEGSEHWNELENKAVEVYLQTKSDDSVSRTSFATQVNQAILQAEDNILDQRNDQEDADDWLNVDAKDFDALLEQKMSTATTNAVDADHHESDAGMEDLMAKEQASRLQELAKKVEGFLEGHGDVEGAQFEDEQSSDETMSEFSDERFSDSQSDSEDPETMDDAAKAARQAAMDKLVPGLDPAEYGAMPPSFHVGSQRVSVANIGTEVVESATAGAEGLQQRPMRGPILMRDTYEGVDSDDETDEENERPDSEDEEDQPQVVGDIEVDMAEEEDEFLEFSRQALGISDEQWADILRDRKSRGAFVPSHVTGESLPKEKPNRAIPARDDSGVKLPPSAPGPLPNTNPNLDSFEAVMQAMDAELARSRKEKTPFVPPPTKPSKGKGKAKEEEYDIETAMEAELQEALMREEEDEDGLPLAADGGMDYNLIKNFLESFKSQGGLAGPVSSLAGRLQPGWGMPRDDSS